MKKRGAFIAASALVHVVFLYWFVHLSFPIRIVYEKSEIREIIIVPQPISFTIPAKPGTGPASALPGGSSVVPGRGTGGMPRGKTAPLPPSFIPETTAPLAEKSKQANGLVLPMAPRRAEKSLNLKRYIDSNLQGWSDLPGLPSAMGRIIASKSGGQEAAIAGDFVSPDLQLWARIAVKLVNQNWIIPLESLLPLREIVVIMVTVNKNGDIIESVLKTPAASNHSKEAALAAVRLTRRMPPLPGGFSEETLQATLLFQYGK